MSPSKFETLAAPSPTKFGVPNRKVRNQPASRIHDIEFAAEISTSLIAQVRNLQALLGEREEELKEVKTERSMLEIETENFQQRIKTLDESENRYKDENWNLETQIHELIAAQKDAAEREKRLTQALNVLQSERTATQRDLEEVKDSLTKQDEKHSAEIKNLEIELGTSRRTAAVFETERSGLQKKVDELTGQNQELARAFSALQRGRTLDREGAFGVSEEDFHSAPDHNTPEHSPPPSPMKPTPRHSALESETLKTSLGHAQRTIQTLRTNIHREKTEKLELKRMLQDARDEVEKMRNDPNAPAKKSRKAEARDLKKPSFKLNQLGVARASRTEVVEDPEWEDQSEAPSPGLLSHRGSALRLHGNMASHQESSSDHFETAHETSDAAFETAHERGTETEDFQTGVEDLSDDDVATETESGPSRGLNSIKRPPSLPPHQSSNHYSFDSTASTSSEDDDYPFSSEMKTPTAGPRMRMRISRGSLSRRSRQFSEEPALQSSPASIPANTAPVTPGGQSLYAELNELDNSDEDSCAGTATPSRRSIRSVTPATPRSLARGRLSPPPELPAMPKVMVDSGMMTEPVDIQPVYAIAETQRDYEEAEEDSISSPRSDVFPERPMSMESVIGPRASHASTQWLGDELRDGESSRPLSYLSYSDASVQHDWDMDAKLAQFPSPPTASPMLGIVPTPTLPPPTLSLSSIQTEFIEPQLEPEIPSSPPSLSVSSILSEQTQPVAEQVELPTLSMPSLISEHVEPLAEPETPVPEPPALSVPTILSQDIEPVSDDSHAALLQQVKQELESKHAEEVTKLTAEAALLSVLKKELDIQHAEEIAKVTADLGSVSSMKRDLEVKHAEELAKLMAELDLASRTKKDLKAKYAEDLAKVMAELEVAKGLMQNVEAAAPTPITLSLSTVHTEQVEPVAEPEVAPPTPIILSVSTVHTEQVEPVAEPEPAPPTPVTLTLSTLHTEQVEPVAEPETASPSPTALSCSTIRSEQVEPIELPTPMVEEIIAPRVIIPLDVPLTFSSVVSEHVEPQSEVPTSPIKLSFSTINAEEVEPLREPETPAPSLAFIPIQTLDLSPREASAPPLALSSVRSWGVEPVEVPEVLPPALSLSVIEAQNIEPIRVEEPKVTPALGFSGIQSLHTEPAEPWSPKRNAFIIPRDADGSVNDALPRSQTPPDEMQGLGSRDLSDEPEAEPTQKQTLATTDQGAQTALTSEAIDQMLRDKVQPLDTLVLERSNSLGSVATPSTVRIHRPRQESFDNSMRSKGKLADYSADVLDGPLRRPGSAASGTSSQDDVPPLPSNHKEVIEAARSGSSQGGQGTIGNMGPPLFPASALKPQNQSLRPRTPNSLRRPISPISVMSGRGTPTPRAAARSGYGTAEVQSLSKMTSRSRKSSVSSFTSEVDTRFNMHQEGGFDPHGLGPNTDPRMIQAITQTMIGEYLWKYTRKTGRGELSENRHRRYFWVHPYTRTLYWSDRDPSAAGRSELRAKSVQIEAVRVVADDNPMPPGLHRKSLIIVSPGRSIKFTCTTGQRHETWFNALSYLLLRTSNDGQSDVEEIAGHITREDVDEFNPQFGRSQANGSRAPPSLSSYNSRSARDSPIMMDALGIPTLTPSRSKVSQQRPSFGTLGRISGYFGSIRSRSVPGRDSVQGIFENPEAQDSAEDVRQMIERQDREADRLENVRACCDGKFIHPWRHDSKRTNVNISIGKHDVGTLTSSAKRAHYHQSLAGTRSPTPGPSTTPTPVGTIRSRA